MAKSKHDKFVRIAESRTNKIINLIRLLGNCSNKSNYDYSDTEVKSIFNAIEAELKIAKSRFQGADSKDNKFKLG